MRGALAVLARPFLAAGLLAPEDVHAVELVAPRFGEGDATRMLGLAFAVAAPRGGHAGVDLTRLAARVDVERPARGRAGAGSAEGALPWPEAEAWLRAALTSPMVGGAKDAERPFSWQSVGGATLLMTRRMDQEQRLLAAALLRRASSPPPARADRARLNEEVAARFAEEPEGATARALRLVLERRLAVIVGGPGTGKTFSITRLLAALFTPDGRGEVPVVALAAPTGKAAVRMREAIHEAVDPSARPPLAVDGATREALLRLEPRTIHRLLGVRPDGSLRHTAASPLPADVVVVDEASMIDLLLMRRLVEAVPERARLILLGDRDQLASVEAGCVLADLVGDGASGPLAAAVQVFTRSFRFDTAPDIALVAACLQSYRARGAEVPEEPAARIALAVEVLTGGRHAAAERHEGQRVRWLGSPEVDAEGGPARPTERQIEELTAPYLDGFEALHPDGGRHRVAGYVELLTRHLSAGGRRGAAPLDPETQREVLAAFARYRVLAVHRRGPLGVAGLEAALARRVRARFGGERRGEAGGARWIGRPLLVTENSYDVGLMNGDVGMVLPTREGVAAVFPTGGEPGVRAVSLARLPRHEGALAMTVHKAQGSQFERVALVLAGRDSSLETRELVYTAVTRARNQLAWLGGKDALERALARRVERASGLEPLLREGAAGGALRGP